jgi:hypothetical protein
VVHTCARVVRLTVALAPLVMTMPNAASLAEGGPYLFLVNAGAESIIVKRSDGTTEFTLGATGSGTDKCTVVLAEVGGVKRWYGI